VDHGNDNLLADYIDLSRKTEHTLKTLAKVNMKLCQPKKMTITDSVNLYFCINAYGRKCYDFIRKYIFKIFGIK